MSEQETGGTTTETPKVSTTVDIPDDVREIATQAGIEDKYLRPTVQDTLAEVAKAKSELNKKLGEQAEELGKLRKNKEPDPKTVMEIPESAEGGDDQPRGALATIQAAGLSAEDLESKWTEKGSLDESDYEAIRKANPALDRETVDSLAKGMAAEAELQTKAAEEARQTALRTVAGKYGVKHEEAGEILDRLLKEAPTYVPADELDDLKARIQSPKSYKGALRDLMAFHAESVGAGKSQPLVSGQPAGGQSLPKTRAELSERIRQAERDIAAGRATFTDLRWLRQVDRSKLPEK